MDRLEGCAPEGVIDKLTEGVGGVQECTAGKGHGALAFEEVLEARERLAEQAAAPHSTLPLVVVFAEQSIVPGREPEVCSPKVCNI